VLNLSKCAGLPWDAILGSEFARAYKPAPEAYLRNVEAIGLSPPEVMMVAAHNGDLFAAGACPPPARPGAPGSQPGTGPGHHPPPARRGRLGRPPAGHWSPAGRHASLGRRGDNQAVQVPGGLAVATQQANRARDRERELRQHQQRRHGWLEANAHLGPQYRQVVRTLAWRRGATGIAVEADRPGYVLEVLGPVPASTRGRRAWRHAAAEIEQYRHTYHITDPLRALGPEPDDRTQRADRQRVRTAIERVQAKQRAADRTLDRQPASEHTSQPRPRKQHGRRGPERAAG
jgi:hypothetical protein